MLLCEISAIVRECEHSLALPFFGIEMKTDLYSPMVIAEFSKFSLYIWKFLVHAVLKPDLENFEHYFASV